MSSSARDSADDVVAARCAGGDDVSAQHPGGACDQDPHPGISISALSPTIIRSVFGSPLPLVSLTLRPSRLASMPRVEVADLGAGEQNRVLDLGAGHGHASRRSRCRGRRRRR